MDHKTHNDAVAKLIQKNLKKDVPSITVQRQGYKGTGSQAHRRQVFIRAVTPEGQEKALDIWLDTGRVQLGGVCVYGIGDGRSSTAFRVGDRTPEETYAELVTQLRLRGF